jgi:hypothetical protein
MPLEPIYSAVVLWPPEKTDSGGKGECSMAAPGQYAPTPKRLSLSSRRQSKAVWTWFSPITLGHRRHFRWSSITNHDLLYMAWEQAALFRTPSDLPVRPISVGA